MMGVTEPAGGHPRARCAGTQSVVRSCGSWGEPEDAVFSHARRRGVVVGPTPASSGWAPRLAREATRRALAAAPTDHVMVVGIAGGLDPALPVGSLLVPAGCSCTPTGPST